ncbi:MAG: EAL domain-containing protein [Thermomonas sp.]|uniref:EAL domain-containing protein n=1 Tax=Thermomonas sp. TaxID=1971895 RepID=UPI0039E45432
MSTEQGGSTPAPATAVDADPFRVLIVEDDRSQAVFAEAILRGAGMVAEVVAMPERMMAALESFNPDLVLMDLHMPGASGTTLTAQIREHPRFSHTPVVFLTGDQDPERQLEALEHGGDDYILKPVRPRHLIAAVQSRVRRARALGSRKQATPELERHPVTGLHTRPVLMQALAAQLDAGEGAALLLEMGNAVALRNRYGYAGFEDLMNEAGRHLNTLAAQHSAARLSDNAFIVLARSSDPASLESCARSLRDGIGHRNFSAEGEPVRLRCSIGYTSLAHGFADTGAVLAATEEALRNARSNPAGIALHVPVETTLAGGIADELRSALADGVEGRLHLAFQPVVAVSGGNDAQFQVLARMRDAEGNERQARDFLPVAQSSGLMPKLDRCVMEQALALLQKRRAEGRPVRLFVSQSPPTLAQDSYASWLMQSLERANVEGTSLVIDLRLDDALVHSMLLRNFCEQLVPTGTQFCLSQYRHGTEADLLLQQLPLGYLRLAADFARQPQPQELRDEMRSVIDRAHRLGLQVIGQAVEDPQAAAALWMGGIDFIQGNLVQRVDEALDFDFQHATL